MCQSRVYRTILLVTMNSYVNFIVIGMLISIFHYEFVQFFHDTVIHEAVQVIEFVIEFYFVLLIV